MAKHTPGPWNIDRPVKGKYRGDFAIYPNAGPTLCYLAAGQEEIQSANARLIAAAPELLAACKAIVTGPRTDDTSIVYAADTVRQMRAAIAKATGES